jgi:DNA invertase Pin-like site-specific DNA recombinase
MTAPGPVNCARFLRVSTDHQDADNQVPEVGQFIAHRGYTLARTFTVSDSAWKNGGGPEYLAALADALEAAHRGEFSVLVVWSLDRICRTGAEDALRIIRKFRERGCTLVSVKESWLNSSPEITDVLVAFAGWQAQMESQRRSDRIRAGIARRRAEGGHTGRKPGSRNRPKSKTRKATTGGTP